METENLATGSNHICQSDSTKQSKNDRKRTEKKAFEIVFCEVCKLNHDQGQRHKYFPSHKKSMSVVFSKFKSKLSDVQFFLRNPSHLRPEHASRSSLWCVFCGCNVDELGSSFACDKIINHLASVDHLKNLKHYMWKHGGDSGSVDKFRITDVELSKWRKKCKSLKKEEAQSIKASINDIHNERDYVNTNSCLDSYNVQSVNSWISNDVFPLQYNTNEYQVFSLERVEVASYETSSFSSHTHFSTDAINLKGFSGLHNQNQNQNQNQTFVPGMTEGNVHSGAPPPWLQLHELDQLSAGQHKISDSSVSEPNRSKKLNPKRVGAAWAERRKLEMELEKRGELMKSEFDVNWLPNFGRVWQSGTRKESRKEFESGKKRLLPEVEIANLEPVKIQPYVSKQNLPKVETFPPESDKVQPCFTEQSSTNEETSHKEAIIIKPYVSKRMLRDAKLQKN